MAWGSARTQSIRQPQIHHLMHDSTWTTPACRGRAKRGASVRQKECCIPASHAGDEKSGRLVCKTRKVYKKDRSDCIVDFPNARTPMTTKKTQVSTRLGRRGIFPVESYDWYWICE
ncbi:hypothetical protein SAMN05444166_5791 [Singulisphaera sp. GP187]|nr:hypothetical protein SAMN05444166_5791 [Singulisphaera sp. GP187]